MHAEGEASWLDLDRRQQAVELAAVRATGRLCVVVEQRLAARKDEPSPVRMRKGTAKGEALLACRIFDQEALDTVSTLKRRR
eukprot:1266964-Prymnesium_polylepis.1